MFQIPEDLFANWHYLIERKKIWTHFSLNWSEDVGELGEHINEFRWNGDRKEQRR